MEPPHAGVGGYTVLFPVQARINSFGISFSLVGAPDYRAQVFRAVGIYLSGLRAGYAADLAAFLSLVFWGVEHGGFLGFYSLSIWPCFRQFL